MRRAHAPAFALALLALAGGDALAKPAVGLYRLDPHGKVRAVRAVDVDGDGRKDLVAIVERPREGAAPSTEVLVLRTPAKSAGSSFFGDGDVTRIACDRPPLDTAGVLAVGRFGPKGEVLLRFVSPAGVADLRPDGTALPGAGPSPPTPVSLGRSPGAPLVFWDGVADLDGDGRDEEWLPTSPLGRASAFSMQPQKSETSIAILRTSLPKRVACDMDGDGRKELVSLDGEELTWTSRGAPVRLRLPFLAPDPSRPPEELHTPRLTLADVDGDGTTDLVVTLVAGRADKLGGLRTSLYHYAGPIRDGKTGALVAPRSRIDTESVALHPRFVDVDGDGRLDYVADSIRGTIFDLVKRVMGADPTIFYTVYRFVPARGTFEPTAWCDVERPYSGAEARGNTFGRSGFLDGDFDGDGPHDLLDLGRLDSVTVLRGAKAAATFEEPLVGPVSLPKGETLVADALITDLDGDGRSDAVLWSDRTLFLVVPQGAR